MITLLGAVALAIATYLAQAASPFLMPFLLGIAAFCAVVVAGAAVVFLSRLPERRKIPGKKNIESCVRMWLDNHSIAVKNDPSPESYFRFRITLDDGKLLTVLRMRDQSEDYVQILADLGVRGDDKKLLEEFSEDEIGQILWDVKVELARAQMGYTGLANPPENFVIFRRVPIHHNLTEFFFVGTINSVEAAMNLVGLMYLKTRSEAERRKRAHGSQPKPLSASDTPELELPKV